MNGLQDIPCSISVHFHLHPDHLLDLNAADDGFSHCQAVHWHPIWATHGTISDFANLPSVFVSSDRELPVIIRLLKRIGLAGFFRWTPVLHNSADNIFILSWVTGTGAITGSSDRSTEASLERVLYAQLRVIFLDRLQSSRLLSGEGGCDVTKFWCTVSSSSFFKAYIYEILRIAATEFY